MGCHCRRPLLAAKGGVGLPLMLIKYVTEDIQDMIHLINLLGKCRLSKTCFKNTHSIEL